MVVGSRLHNIKFVICPQNALYHSISFYIELEYCCPYMKRSTNRVTHILPVMVASKHPPWPQQQQQQQHRVSIEWAQLQMHNTPAYLPWIASKHPPWPQQQQQQHRVSIEWAQLEVWEAITRRLRDIWDFEMMTKGIRIDCEHQKLCNGLGPHKTSKWGDMSETNDPDPHQCRKRGIARNGNT